jgi:hypothetical protein
MNRYWTTPAIVLLLGCLGMWSLWSAPEQNGAALFCVHKLDLQSYFNQDGKVSTVERDELWEKAPDKYYVETNHYIRVSNGQESWFYHKDKKIYRKERPAFSPPSCFTVDIRISSARKFNNQVEVKETAGDPKAGRLPIVDISYFSRDAKPYRFHEHIVLLDEKTRLMKELTVEIFAPDDAYLCRRLVGTYDYAQITDESVFFKHKPPADAVWEKPENK